MPQARPDAGSLVEHLAPVSVQCAGGDRVAGGVFAEGGVNGAGGKEAGEQRTQGSAGSMNAEGVQRVVVTEEALHDEDHKEAEDAGEESDDQRREGLHKAGGGGDGHQSGDRAGDGAQGCGLAVVNPFGDGPADGGGGGGKMGVDKGAGGQGLAASALPALKPNQPTHKRQAPMKLSTMEWGCILAWG